MCFLAVFSEHHHGCSERPWKRSHTGGYLIAAAPNKLQNNSLKFFNELFLINSLRLADLDPYGISTKLLDMPIASLFNQQCLHMGGGGTSNVYQS